MWRNLDEKVSSIWENKNFELPHNDKDIKLYLRARTNPNLVMYLAMSMCIICGLHWYFSFVNEKFIHHLFNGLHFYPWMRCFHPRMILTKKILSIDRIFTSMIGFFMLWREIWKKVWFVELLPKKWIIESSISG